jgi:hypothetical protein
MCMCIKINTKTNSFFCTIVKNKKYFKIYSFHWKITNIERKKIKSHNKYCVQQTKMNIKPIFFFFFVSFCLFLFQFYLYRRSYAYNKSWFQIYQQYPIKSIILHLVSPRTIFKIWFQKIYKYRNISSIYLFKLSWFSFFVGKKCGENYYWWNKIK